ncbi:hypothetical protein I6N95_13155 [Vagococcus sp. BWB3-3]|uniref:Uncharacterized protein n=1 Tax=Vagococcus allomyrinae TaxID=2794353 RepID=A0A940P5V6_9ENTE|nr:hypothetical protein [Vagococcus allomyrinae]MBP1041962.1 hypothetical protein [Vagococcus allomyrinae]
MKGQAIETKHKNDVNLPKKASNKINWGKVILAGTIGIFSLSSLIYSIFGEPEPEVESVVVTERTDSSTEEPEGHLLRESTNTFLAFQRLFLPNSKANSVTFSQRKKFIDERVNSNLVELFRTHAKNENLAEPERHEYDSLLTIFNNSSVSYFILRDGTPYLQLGIDEYSMVSSVMGAGWQEANQEAIDGLASLYTIPRERLIKKIINDFLLPKTNNWSVDLDANKDVLWTKAEARFGIERDAIASYEFESGFYQFSQTIEKRQVILFSDKQMELKLLLILDDLGRVMTVVILEHDEYPEEALAYLKEHAEPRQLILSAS